MGCPICKKEHGIHYHVVNKLTDNGFPVHTKQYKTAHAEASRDEKSRFPKGYEKLKHMQLGKHELIGKNTQSGKILIEKKVAKSLRDEVAFHELDENKRIKKLRGK